MKGLGILLVLVVGIVIGVLGVQMGPDYLKTYLPGPVNPDSGVEGRVVAKLPGEDRLLLTLSTAEGASLLTFTEKVAEVGLLVDRGDLLTVGIHRYSPFITNPPIRRVRKQAEATLEAWGEEREPEAQAPAAKEPDVAREEEGNVPDAAAPEGQAESEKPSASEEAPADHPGEASEKTDSGS